MLPLYNYIMYQYQNMHMHNEFHVCSAPTIQLAYYAAFLSQDAPLYVAFCLSVLCPNQVIESSYVVENMILVVRVTGSAILTFIIINKDRI